MIKIKELVALEIEINTRFPGSIRVQSEYGDETDIYKLYKLYKLRITVHGVTCYIGMTYTNGIYIDDIEDGITDRHRVVAYHIMKYPDTIKNDYIALARWLYKNVMSASYNDLLLIGMEGLYTITKKAIDLDPLRYINYESQRSTAYFSTAYFIREYARSLI